MSEYDEKINREVSDLIKFLMTEQLFESNTPELRENLSKSLNKFVGAITPYEYIIECNENNNDETVIKENSLVVDFVILKEGLDRRYQFKVDGPTIVVSKI